jgi:glutathione S-transferase
MSSLRVFTFEPDWGLPTTGPFALKLLAWLELNGITYEQVVEGNSRKGPLGKSPWIEHDGKQIGDSDVIIRYLAGHYGKPLEAGTPDPRERAVPHVFKTAFEEEFHQILEWELFFHPEGAAYIDAQIRKATLPVVGALVSRMVSRHFHRQLHARGIARHSAEAVAAKGRADLDALAAWLEDRPFLAGPQPVLADLAVFGQVAPVLHWPMDTPVARYAKTLTPVREWCGRVRTACFSRTGQEKPGTANFRRDQQMRDNRLSV